MCIRDRTNTLFASLVLTKGKAGVAGKIAGSDSVIKTILFYFYERAWSTITWGKELPGAAEAAVVDWPELLSVLQDDLVRGSSAPTYLIVHLQYGLGNRLRALASAMAVAAASNRPLAVIWPRDAHCNASFHQLFDAPVSRRFAVLDVDGEAAQQAIWASVQRESATVSYTHLRAHETV